MLELLESVKGITLSEAADLLGVGKNAIVQRKGIESFYLGQVKNGMGRPQQLLSYDILKLWGKSPEQIEEIKIKSLRQGRSDRGKARKGGDIEEIIKFRTKELYLSQANPNNIRLAVQQACQEWININGFHPDFRDEEHMKHYFYADRFMRKDSSGIGCGYSENWKLQHQSIYQQPKFNNMLPNNRYDMIALLTNAGLIGEGFGAGDFRVLDATQFDAWVDDDGNKSLFWYMQLYCPVTGFPLVAAPVVSENTEATTLVLAESYRRYGAPRHGWIFDNSRTNRSGAVRAFAKSFFTGNEQEAIRNSDWQRKLFPGQSESPIMFNLPNIPRFFSKAELERSFKLIKDEFIATRYALTYQGGNRQEAVKFGLNQTPLALKEAPPAIKTFNEFEDWLYSDYIKRYRPSKFQTFAKMTGLKPTIEAAWGYYHNPAYKSYPVENEAYLAYYLSNKDEKHRRKVDGVGYVDITHQNTSHNYISECLDYRLQGRQVCVIPDRSNPERAYIYIEHDARNHDERCREEGTICYLGMAHDSYVRSVDDYTKKRERREIAKYHVNQIKEQTDGHGPKKWENLSEASEFNPTKKVNPALGRMTQPELKAKSMDSHADAQNDNPQPKQQANTPELRNLLESLGL